MTNNNAAVSVVWEFSFALVTIATIGLLQFSTSCYAFTLFPNQQTPFVSSNLHSRQSITRNDYFVDTVLRRNGLIDRRQASNRLLMSKSPDDEEVAGKKQAAPLSAASQSSNPSSSSAVETISIKPTPTKLIDDSRNTGGLTKTLILAVPLFFKFAIVLFIKFLTDLVVFPVLFFWRGCQVAKLRVLSLFGIESSKKKKDTKNESNELSSTEYYPNGTGGKV